MRVTSELNRLVHMHTYARPAGSPIEQAFINRYLVPLGAVRDEHGNYMLVIGDTPRVVWSSHTDTVHRDEGMQRVKLKGSRLSGRGVDSCLGSDDTVGVWLMCEMVRRGVPGRYLWHYGEEKGCIGSRALVRTEPDWLAETDMVIALDRRGVKDVITHQCGSMTCSDAFASALADQLNAGDDTLRYAPSDRGLFTDSESYADDVAECTNLAVGYSDAHSTHESVDCAHALRLLERLCCLDTALLPISRRPGDDGYNDRWTKDAHGIWSRFAETSSSTFWRTYREVENSVWFYCYECGETCDEDDTVCDACKAPYPACLDEDEADAVAQETGIDRASYLDATYAEVQDALRAQLADLKAKKKG